MPVTPGDPAPLTRSLILVRHGVTAWNRAQRLQGHTDTPLDAEGCAQAQRVAARLASICPELSAVFSSDLSRARMTAEAIALQFGLPVSTSIQLRETSLGDWEGLTFDEIIARGDGEKLARYRADAYNNRPPGAEQIVDVWARMQRAAEEIRDAHPAGSIAIVGHGGSLKVLLCAALGASIDSMKHIYLSNAGISIIEETGEPANRRSRIVLMNDTSHLR